MAVTVIEHPLIQTRLTLMRKSDTTSENFRRALEDISSLMIYEVARNFPTTEIEIETPISKTKSRTLVDEKICFVAILRAGLGMISGALKMFPNATVGIIGMYRDEKTLQPVEYYSKLPADITLSRVFVVDPMLATGGSAVDAIDLLKRNSVEKITLISLLSAPEGIKKVEKVHPDVDIFTTSIDEGLNSTAYIIPGLGDAGDRIFNTQNLE